MASAADDDAELERQAIRHKIIAESKFRSSNLKSALKHAKKAHRLSPDIDGLSSMLTAFEILRSAGPAVGDSPDWYKILQVEPFSHINTIRKQYKKLALVLHPDKSPGPGCGDAFKLVNEGFRVFCDRIRRKEYDMKLRIKIQEERVSGFAADGAEPATFWTACSRCRLLHKFERKYVGHNLICPNCKKSFNAAEVESETGGEDKDESRVSLEGESLKKKGKIVDSPIEVNSESNTGSMENVEDGDEMMTLAQMRLDLRQRADRVKGVSRTKEPVHEAEENEETDDHRVSRSKALDQNPDAEVERREAPKERNDLRVYSRRNRIKAVNSEIQTLKSRERRRSSDMVKRHRSGNEDLEVIAGEDSEFYDINKMSLRDREENDETDRQRVLKSKTLDQLPDAEIDSLEVPKRRKDSSLFSRRDPMKDVNSDIRTPGSRKRRRSSKMVRRHRSEDENMDIVVAREDSDFYDFNKDRKERSFKRGQVWAIYDDDDGMPRRYCLINEVASLNPFIVEISWLDLRNDGNVKLISREKMGFHVSCGQFKVSNRSTVSFLNVFSHKVDCERAAREIYRIYPTKGSIWAMYTTSNPPGRGTRQYEIVIFLACYSEMHGLSMAYLEKVNGFKTVFKRREIGCHAISCMEKDDVCLLSHQIPARKLSSNQVPENIKECWELDPASLPSDLLGRS